MSHTPELCAQVKASLCLHTFASASSPFLNMAAAALIPGHADRHASVKPINLRTEVNLRSNSVGGTGPAVHAMRNMAKTRTVSGNFMTKEWLRRERGANQCQLILEEDLNQDGS